MTTSTKTGHSETSEIVTAKEMGIAWNQAFAKLLEREYLAVTADRDKDSIRNACELLNSMKACKAERLCTFVDAVELFIQDVETTDDLFARRHGPLFWVFVQPQRMNRYLAAAQMRMRRRRAVAEAEKPVTRRPDPELSFNPFDASTYGDEAQWRSRVLPIVREWMAQVTSAGEGRAKDLVGLLCARRALESARAHFGWTDEETPLLEEVRHLEFSCPPEEMRGQRTFANAYLGVAL